MRCLDKPKPFDGVKEAVDEIDKHYKRLCQKTFIHSSPLPYLLS